MKPKAVFGILLILFLLLDVNCASRPFPGNVVLITMDTTRFDYFHLIERLQTPSPEMALLQKLLKRSAVSTHAITAINSTNPSHLSILTSQYPATLGIHSNLDRYDRQFPTLPEVLKRYGYNSGAVVSAVHLGNPKFNILKGFEDQVVPRTFFPASRVTDLANYWLSKFYKKKFFLWIHYFDPHVVYEPPRKFVRTDRDFLPPIVQQTDVPSGEILDGNPFFKNWQYGGFVSKWASKYSSLNEIKRLYLGEVLYMCNEIGRFLKYLNELEISKKTLIVLVADHGESLGEHGIYFDHMGLYEPQVKVPLIIFDPSGTLLAGSTDDFVQTIDLFPTILDLLRLPVPRDILGKSLVPLLTKPNESIRAELHQRIAITENTDLLQAAATMGKWKFILPIREDKILDNSSQLYNLAIDPEERKNVLAINPEVAEMLKQKLSEYVRTSRPGQRPALSPEEIENLRSLGYVAE